MSRPYRDHRAAELAAPRRWARGGVGLAVHALPAGPIRERYRQELLADMYGMSRHDQTAHTLGVITHIWALRAAVGAAGPISLEVTMPRHPITCRMNLRHRWRTYSTEDGSRYRRCARCGKDHNNIGNGPADGWFPAGL
jgi:hypothetical protein